MSQVKRGTSGSSKSKGIQSQVSMSPESEQFSVEETVCEGESNQRMALTHHQPVQVM